ncbi:MAG: tetratricopeptide repeat-containing serine/threonine-protein kinase [Gemmatimonadaceae bacterium]|nr:tetratricopeptide repeat-containing serine/threonine-protein kinase [Gemmatimonadaceae bacterium]
MPEPLPPSDAAASGATPSGSTPTPPDRARAPQTMVGTPPEADPSITGRHSAMLLPSLQAALAGSYVIERELGGGGMSRVFVATETALGRTVAIKVLSPELFQGVSAERFAREVALAARLQDAHIVPVLTTGSTPDGLPWYTMPFIEGESLRGRMERGPVPVDEALRILRDVAEALEYAHARGVVHRDIKPENVLLSGRNALVADFGIAKAVSAVRAAVPDGTLTSVGLSLGTPAYMAPEQAAGDAVDHRADVYAWGMMAWELLAGRHPFAGRATAAQLMAAQLAELPAPLDAVRPGLPPALGALVMRCVAKAPEERPADIAAVLTLLGGATTDVAVTSGRRAPVAIPAGRNRTALIGVAAALLALAAGGAWYAQRGARSSEGAGDAGDAAATAAPSLAVLPFEHQGDSADVYLTEGITDEVRNKLTGVQNLLVIARASSNRYRGKDTPPQQIAKELGVRWLLTGTVRVIGTGDQRRVLVRPELVEVTPDGRLQSKGGTPFDGAVTDMMKAQVEVASQVVGSMELAIGGDDRARLVAVPTADPEAYDLYLRGRVATVAGGGVVAGQKRALSFYERAVARDSTLLDGWAAISVTYANLYLGETPAPEYARRARAAAGRINAMAPGSAAALRAQSYVRRLEGDDEGMYRDLQAAERIAPGDAVVLRSLGSAASRSGRAEDALSAFDRAVRLDPQTAAGHAGRAGALLALGRHAEARAALGRARALAPAAMQLVGDQVDIELDLGDLVAARRVLAAAMAEVPRDALLADLATFNDRWWVPTGSDADHLLALGEDAYDTRTSFLTARAQMLHARGDLTKARAHADSAARLYEQELRGAPEDDQTHILLGLMRAYAGKGAEGLAAVERGLAIATARRRPRSKVMGYFHYVAARTAVIAGERARAVQSLERCLAAGGFSAAYLRLDPVLATLKGDPAFERVLAEAP